MAQIYKKSREEMLQRDSANTLSSQTVALQVIWRTHAPWDIKEILREMHVADSVRNNLHCLRVVV
jgi:hypothetical protein